MLKSVQNNSSNGGPDAALECTLYSEFDVALEGAPQSSIKRAIKDAKEVDKKDAFDIALHVALEGAFVSAIEHATVGSSQGILKGVS